MSDDEQKIVFDIDDYLFEQHDYDERIRRSLTEGEVMSQANEAANTAGLTPRFTDIPSVTTDPHEGRSLTPHEKDWYHKNVKYTFTFHSPALDSDSDDLEVQVVVKAPRFGVAYTKACELAGIRVRGLYDLRSVTAW